MSTATFTGFSLRGRGDTDLAGLGGKRGEHAACITFKDLKAVHFVYGEASQPPLLLALSQGFQHDFTGCFVRRGHAGPGILKGRQLRLDCGGNAEVNDFRLAFRFWFRERLHQA